MIIKIVASALIVLDFVALVVVAGLFTLKSSLTIRDYERRTRKRRY